MARLLWIGKESPVVGLLNRNGYHVNVAVGVEDAVGDLRASPPDLVILDKNSCLQGELAAVRLKSAAPKVPILLICEPRESGAPQVFFVNMILSSATSPELVMRAIASLLPATHHRTGT